MPSDNVAAPLVPVVVNSVTVPLALTVCQEQVPSPSSLKYLFPPLSPVDLTSVPSGV